MNAILTKSQPIVSPQFSPAAESLIGLVCDTLNTSQHDGPAHDVMKSMLDIVGQVVHSPDDRYVDFISFLFVCAADEYLRKPEPSVSVERLLLDLTVEALAYCVHERMAIPGCVRGMLPCVQDALEHGDDEYVEWTHERFEIVVKGRVFDQYASMRKEASR